jgi:hypothetical protein
MSRETYAALLPLAQEIALQLTKKTKSEWTLRKSEEGEYTYYHIDSGNAAIYLTTEYGKTDRVSIGGTTPRGKDRQYVRVYEDVKTVNGSRWEEVKFSSITVATARGAETIAKNIISRFLPDYLKAVRLTVAKIAADEQYAADKRTNLEACAATLHEVLRSDYREIRGCDDVYEPLGSFSASIGNDIRIEVQADSKTIDLKIENLTVETARDILEHLQNTVGWFAGH